MRLSPTQLTVSQTPPEQRVFFENEISIRLGLRGNYNPPKRKINRPRPYLNTKSRLFVEFYGLSEALFEILYLCGNALRAFAKIEV